MCDIPHYKETDGGLYAYKLASANTKLGCDMIHTLKQLKGGKSKKKRYSYNNGISNYFRKKLHKTRRFKTHLFRRFFQNPISKKGGVAKISCKQGKICKSPKKKYARP